MKELRNARIFITGGTGFFGRWLLETFAHINTQLNLNASLTVLTRNPEEFAKKAPHLSENPAITLHRGDILDFSYPEGQFTHLIHAATPASADLNANDPLKMSEIIIQGTVKALQFGKASQISSMLVTSSGAVYGAQPNTTYGTPETVWESVNPTEFTSAYSLGKWTAEKLAAMLSQSFPFDIKTARGFAFVGPFLPLDIHFAIGNFIKNTLENQPIIIAGNPNTYRSYLYSADLALWLWTILIKGPANVAYNVGAPDAISIGELAQLVSNKFEPHVPVIFADTATPNAPQSRYVPDVKKIEIELGLTPQFTLEESIRRTLQWHQISK